MARMHNLRDLFNEQIMVLFYAEKKFQKTMVQIVDHVSSKKLKNELQEHVDEGKKQVNRLDRIINEIDLTSTESKCLPMDGIIDEIKNILNEDAEAKVMDAAIIAEVQKALHFKIACYGTLRTYAEVLDIDNIAMEIKDTLEEEKERDKRLTKIAQSINEKALESH